jgi:hypothetical protein
VINGGNIESFTTQYAIQLKGLSTSNLSSEQFWTHGVVIKGLRLWSTLGVVINDGVSDVDVVDNAFIANDNWTLLNGTATCIYVSSPSGCKYLRNINYGRNKYYAGADPVYHINDDSNSNRNTSQVTTQNNERIGMRVPFYGKFWKAGTFVRNGNSGLGQPYGWWCITTADGTNDNSAVWGIVGQQGYRSNAGSPVSVLYPLFIGEEVFDSTNKAWYKSVGTSNTDWKQTTN